MKKILFIIVPIIIILILVIWKVYEKNSIETNNRGGWSRGSRDDVVAVEVENIRKKNLTKWVTLTGSLKPQSKYFISSKTTGKIEKLFVDMGDEIENGQLLAKLEDSESRLQVKIANTIVKSAESNLESVKNIFEQSKKNLLRKQKLFDRDLISKSEIELALADYNKLNANLKIAKSNLNEKLSILENANIKLSYSNIYADWDNSKTKKIIGEKILESGSLVNSNTPIYSVLDINNLIGSVSVTETDFLKLEKGLSAKIKVNSFPGKTFFGEIVRIAPFLNENTREAKVDILIPNTTKILKPGMFITASIIVAEKKNVITVPTNALVGKNNNNVFVVDNNSEKVNLININIGIIENGWAEIISPQLNGRVVTLGHHLLRDGSKIIIPDLKNKTKNNKGKSNKWNKKNKKERK